MMASPALRSSLAGASAALGDTKDTAGMFDRSHGNGAGCDKCAGVDSAARAPARAAEDRSGSDFGSGSASASASASVSVCIGAGLGLAAAALRSCGSMDGEVNPFWLFLCAVRGLISIITAPSLLGDGAGIREPGDALRGVMLA